MIIRSEHTKNFTIIDNGYLDDPRLEGLDIALMTIMLSKPNDWVFYEDNLCEQLKKGVSAVRNAIRRLEAAGYLERAMKRNKQGKFERPDWTVHEISIKPLMEKPFDGKPSHGKPSNGQPSNENHAVLNTNEQRTNKPSMEDQYIRRAVKRTGAYKNIPTRDRDMDELENLLLKSNETFKLDQ